jgi:hypothetical protein
MRFLLLTFLLFACLSCADKNRTPNMLSRSEFESVYIELLDSASVNAQVPMDSVMSPATNRILRRRGILLSQFTATVLAFNDEPTKWKEFYESVTKKIDYRDSVMNLPR